jgi:cation:H+ antiporter
MEWFLTAVGLVILLLAGDALVKGAVNLSLRIGIPAIIVSLTIVAFGTSAPELLIAVQAILDDAPGLAMGNVVGSNTANVLLVLGLPAILAGMSTRDCETRKSYLQMLGATVLFIVLAFGGTFGFVQGVVLLAALGLIMLSTLREAKRSKGQNYAEEDELEGADPNLSGLWIAFYLILGLVGLPFGASILVDNASIIARDYGVSETVIGLTLVAVGTSLPELATTVMAALRKQADVALGNVIGSNLFNLLGIIGVASLVGNIPVDPAILHFDLWVMLAASLALIPFVFLGRNLTRGWGVLLTGLYLIYVIYVVV